MLDLKTHTMFHVLSNLTTLDEKCLPKHLGAIDIYAKANALTM